MTPLSPRQSDALSYLAKEQDDMGRRRLQQKGHLFRDGDWWRLRWYEDVIKGNGEIGRRRASSVIGRCNGPEALTERKARRKAWDDVLSKVDSYTSCPQSLMTLGQFVQHRFEPEWVWSLKHAGKLHYQYCLGRILPAFGHKALRDIKAQDIQRFVREAIELHKLSVQTATHLRNALSAIFHHAKKVGFYTGENPASLVRLPEMTRNPRNALTWEQGKAALDALPSPIMEMVLLSMTTSLNVAELCGLRCKWVNVTEAFKLVEGEAIPPRSIAVRENYYRNKYGSLKTGKRRRTVPIPAVVLPYLEKLLKRTTFNGPEDPLFVCSAGTPIDAHNVNSRLFKEIGEGIKRTGTKTKKIGDGLKLHLTWHIFRHSCATFAEEVGMVKSDRIALMGHGSATMTDHYTHSDIERMRTGVSAIAEKLFGGEKAVPQPDLENMPTVGGTQ